MIYYIIEDAVKHKNKEGIEKEYKHYFQKHTGYPLPLNHMTGNINEAARYDCKSEAKRIAACYLGVRKNIKVLKIVTDDNN